MDVFKNPTHENLTQNSNKFAFIAQCGQDFMQAPGRAVRTVNAEEMKTWEHNTNMFCEVDCISEYADYLASDAYVQPNPKNIKYTNMIQHAVHAKAAMDSLE